MTSAVVVLGVVLAFSLLLALLSRLRLPGMNIEQYLVGGRSFRSGLLFFLAVGEIYSIGTMIGLPGGIYAKGTGYGVWFLGYILLAYPIGYFLGPLIWRAARKYDALTVPDVFRAHFSSRSLEIASALAALGFLVGWGQFQFTGLEAVFSGLGLGLTPVETVAIAVVIAFIYIVASGIRSNAYVAIVKDIFMIGGIAIAGLVAAAVAPGGVPHIFGAAARHGVPSTVTGPALVFAMTTIAIQAVAFYLGVGTFLFTGRSEGTVKKTQVPMPLYMLMYPLLAFASYYAITRLPHLKNPNDAFMAISRVMLPGWAVGIIAAGAVLAGILVLASFSLFLGPIICRNFVPGMPREAQTRWVNVTVAVFLIVSAVLAVEVPSLMLNILNLAYYFEIQVVPAWLCLMFVGRVRGSALTAGIVVGIGLVIGMYAANVTVFSINIGLVAVLGNAVVALAVNWLLNLARGRSGRLTPVSQLEVGGAPVVSR